MSDIDNSRGRRCGLCRYWQVYKKSIYADSAGYCRRLGPPWGECREYDWCDKYKPVENDPQDVTQR
jgi:hypothetical protein